MSNEKIKILFVCMGNICRSPTAEDTFHAQMQKRSVQDLFEIDSAGTHAYLSSSTTLFQFEHLNQ
jgi:protein-tyrosine phosphatase